MSRRIENELKSYLIQYKRDKDVENKLVKENKSLGDKIKSLMTKENLEEFNFDGFTAKVSSQDKYDFNEEKAIEILKSSLPADTFNKVVKTKFYIDDDALEALVYDKQFDMAKLAECQEYKTTVQTLRIVKTKKGE